MFENIKLGASAIYSSISAPIVYTLIGVSIVVGLLTYFWLWVRIPIEQVPPHLSDGELKKLEIQDRLRKTQIQIPFVIALVSIFILMAVQFWISAAQWQEDFAQRTQQLQIAQLSETIKQLSAGDEIQRVGGAASARLLIEQDPDKHIRRTKDILATLVRARTLVDGFSSSQECNWTKGNENLLNRPEAKSDVQASMSVLGARLNAERTIKYFDKRSRQCEFNNIEKARPTRLADATIISHRFLDYLNLSDLDFTCADFSASYLRTVTFEDATLKGADLRGVKASTNYVPDFQKLMMQSWEENKKKNSNLTRAEWLHDGNWRPYRCWITFFKNADLEGARFEGADLSGASFHGAILKDAKFNGANVTRVDFRNVRGLSRAELERRLKEDSACVDDGDMPLLSESLVSTDLKPSLTLNFELRACR